MANWNLYRDHEGRVLSVEEPPAFVPRAHRVAEIEAATKRTRELSDRAAFTYSAALELLGKLREGVAERRNWVTNRGAKDMPRMVPHPTDPFQPMGPYVDPDDARAKEAAAGRFFLRDCLVAERRGRRC